jgi:hypothetical protein
MSQPSSPAAAPSRGGPAPTYGRILVALDGSALAECSLPHAAMLARHLGAAVTLLRVVPPRGPLGCGSARGCVAAVSPSPGAATHRYRVAWGDGISGVSRDASPRRGPRRGVDPARGAGGGHGYRGGPAAGHRSDRRGYARARRAGALGARQCGGRAAASCALSGTRAAASALHGPGGLTLSRAGPAVLPSRQGARPGGPRYAPWAESRGGTAPRRGKS